MVTVMKDWMKTLSDHYETMRTRYPNDRLLILFDIDGTILDMRYKLFYLLKIYDLEHDTGYFSNLNISDLSFGEESLGQGLKGMKIPESAIREIQPWYQHNCWSVWSLIEANRPFPGVMEVIRWFQLQEKTFVGLNSSRAEVLREETLQSLNRLGQEFRVHFDDDLLKMRPSETSDIAEEKVFGISSFRKKGYRVIAMIDNEPSNLDSIANNDESDEILLLHASMMFRGNGTEQQISPLQGNVYDITRLIPRRSLPQHIEFVWNNINNENSLLNFLSSNVYWSDITAVASAFVNSGVSKNEHESSKIRLLSYLSTLLDHNKGIRIALPADAKRGGKLIKSLKNYEIDSSRLWLTGRVDTLGESFFRLLRDTFPEARLECPIDFLIPVVMSATDKAEHILDIYMNWGIQRFSLSWKSEYIKRVYPSLEKRGFDIIINGVSSLQEFLQAVLLLPTAIVSDFNYPMWSDEKDEHPGQLKSA